MLQRQLNERTRKFLREVGSIVLGVLIALGIGQVADDFRWRSRASDTNRDLDIELARAAGVFDERVLAQPCLDRRLTELDAIVRAARRTGSLPDLSNMVFPPVRPLQTSAWDDAVASGTLPHLTPSRRSMLSLNYPLLKSYPEQNQQELLAWANLRMLANAPGPTSEVMLAEAAGIIARLQIASKLNEINARQIRHDILAQGLKPSYMIILDYEGTRDQIVKLARTRCQAPLVSPRAIGG